MTTELDLKLVPKAKELLDRFGMTVTYTEVDSGSYDPSTGQTSGGSNTDHEIKIAPPFPVRADLVDGEVYQFGDQLTYLADDELEFEPTAGEDRVLIGGETLLVIGARPIRSGDDIAVWELQLRKN